MTIMSRRNTMFSSPPYTSLAPPPSPIPTARGVRSAANSIFSDYLSRNIKIPELSLPEYVHRSVPSDINRHSLLSGESDSVQRLLRSAAEFGAFRISGHGIAVEEIRSALSEADVAFQISCGRRREYCRSYSDCEEFEWRRLESAVAVHAGKAIGAEKFRSFSYDSWLFKEKPACTALPEMKNLSASPTKIGPYFKQLAHTSWTYRLPSSLPALKIQPKEPFFSIYRYDHEAFTDKSAALSKENKVCEHALTLHLLLEPCEFHIQSDRGPLSFDASPGTILVTVGKQLEEWSQGEFKSASGNMTLEHHIAGGIYFSLQLKCSPSDFNRGLDKFSKTISVFHQVLFIITAQLLYKFVTFIFD
ncbi:hypothetical protein NMG60_11000079 [Bertholletia excelsa]